MTRVAVVVLVVAPCANPPTGASWSTVAFVVAWTGLLATTVLREVSRA